MTAHTRARGEGSIYPYRNGRYAAYVWVTTLTGERRRKYVYGDTRQQVHADWIELHHAAARSALATRSPQVRDYLACWLRDVVEPFAKPKTAETYARNIRLYVIPYLGEKRLDQLSVVDVRRWLRRLTSACQCCAQGKDVARRSGTNAAARWVTAARSGCRVARSSMPAPSSGLPWPKQSRVGWSATTRPPPSGSREPAHAG